MKAKKFLSLLMSLAMILTALPLSGVTAFAEKDGDFEYAVLEDGTAKITGYTGSAETLDIPSKLGTYTVTSIGWNAFAYCESLTSITIPESVTSIGEEAFEHCSYLTEIRVNANNKNYTSQEGVLFDKDITELMQYPNGKVGASYDIPKGVTSIDDSAFAGCDLTSVTIPESVTSIGDNAFSDCDGLTSITILNGVKNIGEMAFMSCDYLASITIPESVTSIGERAFGWCSRLTEINVDTNNKNYSSQNGVLFNKNITELIQYPLGKAGTSYDIPDGVTRIGIQAFYNCYHLTSITIPESVTSIGHTAFSDTGYDYNDSKWENGVLYIDNCLVAAKSDEVPENYKINEGTRVIGDYTLSSCESLTSVTIPDSVTSIGEAAFTFCESLTSVAIGNGVTSIGKRAFDYCTSLTSITIGNSVTSIGDDAFTSTEYYSDNSNWENGVLYIDNYLIKAKNNVPENYTINEGTRVIADRAFDCYDLTSVTIPESVISIGNEAFYECYSLTDIYILNKDCSIASSDAIPAETTIHGYAGSTAESYAEEHGNKFDMICNHSNMKKVEAKAATCTEDGNIDYYHCPECNRNYEDINGNEEITDVVVKAAHKMGEKVEAKAATCTEDGNVAYYHCSACNKNFKDIDGNEEITDVVVKATGHKFENGVCTVCGEKEPVTPDKQNAIGDVDGNKNITITDAKWILQNTVKSRTLTEKQAKAADLNKDGKITIVDAKWVLQIVVGLRDAQTLKPIKK